MQQLESKRLFTVGEIARLLSVPPSWVYRAKDTRGMPFYQVGVYVRFDSEEVMQWLRESQITRTGR